MPPHLPGKARAAPMACALRTALSGLQPVRPRLTKQPRPQARACHQAAWPLAMRWPQLGSARKYAIRHYLSVAVTSDCIAAASPPRVGRLQAGPPKGRR